jgi:dienelactone hydrolase
MFAAAARADIDEQSASLFLDFARAQNNVRLHSGAHRIERNGGALAFTTAAQFAELAQPPKLNGVAAASCGGWFFLKRTGEQAFFSRGLPELGENGERIFRPATDWTKFFIGTDQRGFFMGSMNGNSRMPFPLVTLDEPSIDAWHQLVVVKEANGIQRFFDNGTQVHTDAAADAAGVVVPFHDTADGEPIRLAMPHGGMIGEIWIFPRALTAAEIRGDFEAKRARYTPALPVAPVALREMNGHPAPNLWRTAPSSETWPAERARIEAAVKNLLGPFPQKIPALAVTEGEPIDCGDYIRRKVSFQVESDDRMPAWLLVPKARRDEASPAVICMYGTTSGAGKDTTVGLSGAKPGTPPQRNRAFAIDMVQAGFVALAPDWLRDGERLPPSGRPYDTTDFYKRHPDWSCVGKDVWDTMRAVDYLQTLPFVDAQRIGMVGHSYGGHTTIFAAALEPRIRVVFSSGPVSDFLHHGMHWAVDRGGGASQSLPGLRAFVLDQTKPVPVTFYEWTSLIAPRPLWVQQAVGERRPMEEENHAAVAAVYRALGVPDRVKYMWQAGDHDFPPEARRAAVEWFTHWFAEKKAP